MKAKLTAYNKPIITPEVMEHVGRHIVFNACIWCHQENTEEKEHKDYVSDYIYIPASRLNAWFSHHVNKSCEIETSEGFRDAGYNVFYHAVECDSIDDVYDIASGEKTQAVIYWLELDQFFDKYIEALVEQASLPENSIIVDTAAIQTTEEAKKEGLITVPVLIRKELSYTIQNCYSLASFLRKMIVETGKQSLDADALWDFYESVTSYGDQHVDDWNIVTSTTHYIRIDSDD